jgi:iron complex outermembrane receptor protein
MLSRATGRAGTPTDALFGGEVRFDLLAPRLPFGLSGSAAWVRALNLDTGGYLAFVPADRYWLAGRYFWPDTAISMRGYLELNNLLNLRYRDYNSLLRYFADEPGWGLQLRFAVEFDVELARE